MFSRSLSLEERSEHNVQGTGAVVRNAAIRTRNFGPGTASATREGQEPGGDREPAGEAGLAALKGYPCQRCNCVFIHLKLQSRRMSASFNPYRDKLQSVEKVVEPLSQFPKRRVSAASPSPTTRKANIATTTNNNNNEQTRSNRNARVRRTKWQGRGASQRRD